MSAPASAGKLFRVRRRRRTRDPIGRVPRRGREVLIRAGPGGGDKNKPLSPKMKNNARKGRQTEKEIRDIPKRSKLFFNTSGTNITLRKRNTWGTASYRHIQEVNQRLLERVLRRAELREAARAPRLEPRYTRCGSASGACKTGGPQHGGGGQAEGEGAPRSLV